MKAVYLHPNGIHQIFGDVEPPFPSDILLYNAKLLKVTPTYVLYGPRICLASTGLPAATSTDTSQES